MRDRTIVAIAAMLCKTYIASKLIDAMPHPIPSSVVREMPLLGVVTRKEGKVL